MHIALAVLFLTLVSLTRAEYSIDDRDGRIQYFGPHWVEFSDSTAYMGTTTDNACLTQDNCYFTVSFLGSGVSLTRFIIYTIPIPLQATVTVDGTSQPDISIPDGSPAVMVYDLEGLNYGSHLMRVTLVSYSPSVQSHFRFDRAIINDTSPPTTSTTPTAPPLTSSSSPTSQAGTTTSSSSTLPVSGRISTKKVPMAAIASGTVVGAVACGIAIILVVLYRRQKPGTPGLGREKVDSQQYTVTPFDVPAVLASLNPPLPMIVSPLRSFPPDIQDDIGLNGHPRPGPVMFTPPNAASRFVSMPIVTPFPSTTPTPVSPPLAQPVEVSQEIQGFGTDSDAITAPGSITPSAVLSSTPFMSRFERPLSDEEVITAAALLNQRVPPSDVTRILDAMQTSNDITNAGVADDNQKSEINRAPAFEEQRPESIGATDAVGSRAYPSALAPPAYDFKG